jgi:hypothetical protein
MLFGVPRMLTSVPSPRAAATTSTKQAAPQRLDQRPLLLPPLLLQQLGQVGSVGLGQLGGAPQDVQAHASRLLARAGGWARHRWKKYDVDMQEPVRNIQGGCSQRRAAEREIAKGFGGEEEAL